MIDPNLIRWINLSVNKYLDDAKAGYYLHIEGQELAIPQETLCWAELHFSHGPTIDEVSAGSFEIELLITIMATAVYNDDDQLLNKISGFFQNLLSHCIDVFKYGTDTQDTNAFIGVLQPKKAARTFPWGPIIADGKLSGPVRAKAQSIEQEFHMSL